MKLGIMGRLFPAAFGKVVYDYTVKALPDLDIREFKKKQKKEYKAMVARTPSVGSMKENMFAPVMYLACFGFSCYKADPEHITMDVFDGMIDALCKSAMGRAAAVSVNDDLTACQSGISMRPADNKTAGRVDKDLRSVVKKLRRYNRLDHKFDRRVPAGFHCPGRHLVRRKETEYEDGPEKAGARLAESGRASLPRIRPRGDHGTPGTDGKRDSKVHGNGPMRKVYDIRFGGQIS